MSKRGLHNFVRLVIVLSDRHDFPYKNGNTATAVISQLTVFDLKLLTPPLPGKHVAILLCENTSGHGDRPREQRGLIIRLITQYFAPKWKQLLHGFGSGQTD